MRMWEWRCVRRRVPPVGILDLARAERADLADLLAGLTPEQWETPSLCAGWTVRQVVAHAMSYEGLTLVGVTRRVAAARFDPDAANRAVVDGLDHLTPDELVRSVREHLTPAGFTAWFGGRIGLTDGLIHHQDVRRPLGLARAIPEDRLRPVLGFALVAPPIRGVLRVYDLRLEATDMAWSFGPVTRRRGVVRGPAEALLMAIAGRPVAHDLEGDGVPFLAPRLA